MKSNDLGVVEIPLTQGLFAVIDEVDAPAVLAHKWHAVVQTPTLQYAARSVVHGSSRRRIYMHRFLLSAQPSRTTVVDHINHNGLDNRRGNLRLVSQSENIRNARIWRAPEMHNGVTVQGDSWVSKINFEKRQIYLGLFRSYEEACAAYVGAYVALFGRPFVGKGSTQ